MLHGHGFSTARTYLRRRTPASRLQRRAAVRSRHDYASDSRRGHQDPDPQRRHGHGHRVQAGGLGCPSRRPWDRASQHVDRAASRRGGSREAQRVGDDRRPDHDQSRCQDQGRSGVDGELPDFGRAGYPRQHARRNPDQSRPAVRETPRHARQRSHDQGESGHGARGDDVRGGRETPPQESDREALGRQRTERVEGAHHGQGHPEEANLSERIQGQPGPAACRRRGWSQGRLPGASAGAIRSKS